ncbi:unnamed protein product [Periconia digitata]|uniref:Rhodopsin domain-containing protein n=1 Tax=Periconia digitata TaxID=1303443 RepID=A0A9W4XKK3_9PLEO|nr:unnamed protein product [Periconia digitata]
MNDDHVDKGPMIVRVMASTIAVGGVFVWARVFTRTVIRPFFGLDDALIVLTWFLILGYNIAMFISVHRGYGRHVTALLPERYVEAIHAEVIGQVFAIASFPSGKASIAVLLLRLFPGKKLRWFLWTFVAANAVFFYIDAIFILVQCQPVAFQWDHSIPGGKCWNPQVVIVWGFLTGVTGALTDFVFALLPWFYITKVQISLKEKLSVGVALSAGFAAGVCSIMKIYYTSTLGAHADYTYDTIPLIIWSCVELALINIAACIPTLRPLYLWIRGENVKGTSMNQSGYDMRYGSGTGRLNRFANRSGGATELGSSDHVHELNIYQSKTLDVTFEDRKDYNYGYKKSSSPGIRTTVEVHHGNNNSQFR